MNTPFGVQTPLLQIRREGGSHNGTLSGDAGTTALEQLKVEGMTASFTANISTPMGSFPVSFNASINGDNLSGVYETMMGATDFTGVREQ